MCTCNRLDLQTLGSSQPVMPKNLPTDHWSQAILWPTNNAFTPDSYWRFLKQGWRKAYRAPMNGENRPLSYCSCRWFGWVCEITGCCSSIIKTSGPSPIISEVTYLITLFNDSYMHRKNVVWANLNLDLQGATVQVVSRQPEECCGDAHRPRLVTCSRPELLHYIHLTWTRSAATMDWHITTWRSISLPAARTMYVSIVEHRKTYIMSCYSNGLIEVKVVASGWWIRKRRTERAIFSSRSHKIWHRMNELQLAIPAINLHCLHITSTSYESDQLLQWSNTFLHPRTPRSLRLTWVDRHRTAHKWSQNVPRSSPNRPISTTGNSSLQSLEILLKIAFWSFVHDKSSGRNSNGGGEENAVCKEGLACQLL